MDNTETSKLQAPGPFAGANGSVTVDELIKVLESRGLGWSLDNTGRLIEARVWDWPNVIGRYRPNAVEPLAKMLAEAMYQVDWTRYPGMSDDDNTQDDAGVAQKYNVLVSEQEPEIRRLRLTDAEREAIRVARDAYADDDGNPECESIAAVLSGLLERTK